MFFYEENITMGAESNHICIKYNNEVLYDGVGKFIERRHNYTSFLDENDQPRKFCHGLIITTS